VHVRKNWQELCRYGTPLLKPTQLFLDLMRKDKRRQVGWRKMAGLTQQGSDDYNKKRIGTVSIRSLPSNATLKVLKAPCSPHMRLCTLLWVAYSELCIALRVLFVRVLFFIYR
jgi:hypothetical protein